MPADVRHGDCLDVMRGMPDASVHAIVTDPPYGLGFMGKEWDDLPPGREWAAECLRVLRPGGYLLAFGGTRTFHCLACAVEDAGFEIRDSIAWLYGSGFPKSLDVSKAIDKTKPPEVAADIEHVRKFLEAQWRRSGVKSADVDAAFGFRGNMSAPHWFYKTTQNAVPTAEQWPTLLRLLGVALGDVPESVQAAADRVLAQRGLPGPAWELREVIDTRAVQDIRNGHGRAYGGAMFAGEDTGKIEHQITAPATAAAQQWAGWGTALKPAFEPVVVARKPLAGSVAANVQEWGTGALNIAACRVGTDTSRGDRYNGKPPAGGHGDVAYGGAMREAWEVPAGRWPANVVLDGSQADALDQQSGTLSSWMSKTDRAVVTDNEVYGEWGAHPVGPQNQYGDTGGASRFFKVVSDSPADHVFFPIESVAWQQLGDGSTRAASTSAGSTTASKCGSSPTGGCGSRPTAPFLMAMRSTTATTTPSTTPSTTSCVSRPSGMTTTTSDYASSTGGSTALSSDAANDAKSTSRPVSSPSAERERSTATADPAPSNTDASGLAATATSSTPSGANGTHRDSVADFPTFRYQAKAPTSERPTYTTDDGRKVAHPTVKPLGLMRWLVRLVTPPGGTVLDPFAGSGATVEACLIEGFDCIAIERDADYLPLIQQRIDRQAGTLPLDRPA